VTAQILAEQQTAEEEVAKAAGAEEGLLRQLQDQIMATVSEDCDRKLHETADASGRCNTRSTRSGQEDQERTRGSRKSCAP
jgi:hypothetical protein